jgi:hypothetical protein
MLFSSWCCSHRLYSSDPASDLQAMDRAYRFGQTRDVSVYRLLGAGSIEELIYARQLYKQQQMAIGLHASVQTRCEQIPMRLQSALTCRLADILKACKEIRNDKANCLVYETSSNFTRAPMRRKWRYVYTAPCVAPTYSCTTSRSRLLPWLSLTGHWHIWAEPSRKNVPKGRVKTSIGCMRPNPKEAKER